MVVTQKDIHQNVQLAGCYPPKVAARVVHDVSQVSATYGTLSPMVGHFTGTTGVVQRLLYIGGTIPITYRGAVYTIPVRIWLMPYHPEGPPTIMVSTSEKLILVSGHRNVDSRGQVYLPELHEWDARSSTITSVVAKMIAIFSAVPPLRARAVRPQVVPAEQDRRALVTQLRARVVAALTQKTEEGRKEYVRLQRLRGEVVAAEATLSDAEKQVSGEVRVKKDAIAAVEEKYEEVQRKLEKHGVNDGDMPLDSMIRTDPLTLQVVGCVAADQACLDSLEAVSDALGTGSINLEQFLKETRRLSVDMYNARALKNKIRSMQQKP